MKKKLLSLIVPCYNEEQSLSSFIRETLIVLQTIENLEGEIIFIDDGSSDGTLRLIRELREKHPCVRYISFSRNFGKESAILAGMQAARGDYAAVMDADLQDPPALLPEMLRAIREEGYDCVGTRRTTRKGEPPVRSFLAHCFYRLINRLSDTKLMDGARDYKLLSRKALDALLSMPEKNRFTKGLYEWIGFRTKWLTYENIERTAGESKWSLWRLFKYSLVGIISFTSFPLHLSALLGILFMGISLLLILSLSIRQIIYHSSVDGWTSLVCIILLLSGIQLFSLGIIGQYLSRMFTEIKRRPSYIISEQSN